MFNCVSQELGAADGDPERWGGAAEAARGERSFDLCTKLNGSSPLPRIWPKPKTCARKLKQRADVITSRSGRVGGEGEGADMWG